MIIIIGLIMYNHKCNI